MISRILLLGTLLLFSVGCSDDSPKQKSGSILFANTYVTTSEKNAQELLEKREKRLKTSGAELVEGLLKVGHKSYMAAVRKNNDDAQIIECIIYEMVMKKYKEHKSQEISNLRDEIAKKTGISIDSARMSWTIQKLYRFLNFVMEIYVDRGTIPQQGTFSTTTIGNDAWGNEIRIYTPEEYKTMTGKGTLHFLIISAGRDGVYDNLDDMRLPFTKYIKLPKTRQQLEEARKAAKKIAVDKLKKIRKRDDRKRKKIESIEDLMQEDTASEDEKKTRKPRERKSIEDLM